MSRPPRSRAMYFRKKTSGGRAYLQIVENRREGVAVRQQVIATLGRVEDLRMSGQLERLLRSGARFAAKAIVVDAVAAGEATTSATRRIGAALVFERLWEETGCRKVVEDLAGARKHDFALERAVFLTVLHRLFAGGSDRAADRWREDYRIEGVEGLDLQPIERGVKFVLVDLAQAEFDPLASDRPDRILRPGGRQLGGRSGVAAEDQGSARPLEISRAAGPLRSSTDNVTTLAEELRPGSRSRGGCSSTVRPGRAS